jgi:hypothetical protein
LKEENKMKNFKLLALIPVVALAAACNGVAPTSPSNLATFEQASVAAQANATGITPQSCNVTRIVVSVIPNTSDRIVLLRASYLPASTLPMVCAAPSWTASQTNVLVPSPSNDSFTVGVDVSKTKLKVLVKATAPNGVQGAISLAAASPTK